jgi:urease accessory protein
MRERVDAAGLYRLLAWLSPGFPIGAFGYSHGLEAAVEAGDVGDRSGLQGWIAAVVTRGAGRIDADIVRDAHRAAAAADLPALDDANRRGLAFRATAETALESGAQGAAFLAACRAAWPLPLLDRLASLLGETGICYPAAFGAAAGAAQIPLGAALAAYLQAMAANLVSAGLRLGIVGQSDGQRILAALEPAIASAAAAAEERGEDEFGSATFAVELYSIAHETQYSRLFRS